LNKYPLRKLIDTAFAYRKRKDFESAKTIFDEISKRLLMKGRQREYLAFKAHKIECEAQLLRRSKQFDLYIQRLREAEDIWHQLGDEKNATWCRANVEATLAKKCFKEKMWDGAVQHYSTARELYLAVGDEKAAKFCEAYSTRAEACALKHTDPNRAAMLANTASDMFREAGALEESLICRADAFHYSGIAKFRDGLFQEAKEDFLKAAEISEKLGSEKFSAFCKAYAYQCDYRTAKLNHDIRAAIEALQESSSLFQKAGVEEAYYVSMGDLHRLKGFEDKTRNDYEGAVKDFQYARDYYLRAAGISKRSKSRHERSARYMDALILSTEADSAMIFSQDMERASELYLKSAEIYKELGDEPSASFTTNVGLLLRAFTDKNWEQASQIAEALLQHYSAKGDLTQLSITHNFVKLLSTILMKRREEMMQELYVEDAGFGFEARVRELFMKFDGRAVSGSLLGSEEGSVILHKYDEVREASFEPEDDEVGIVFNDKSIIEIDVLAIRRERGRQFVAVCECKYGRKPVSVSDLDLLERKSRFVEARYGKIARLAGEPRPKMEEKWFVATSHFENGCTEYAKRHNIRLIDLKKLNNLMKEFGLRKILGPRPKA